MRRRWRPHRIPRDCAHPSTQSGIAVGGSGDPTWLPLADGLNMLSLSLTLVGVFILPVLDVIALCTASELFGLAALLLVGYAFTRWSLRDVQPENRALNGLLALAGTRSFCRNRTRGGVSTPSRYSRSPMTAPSSSLWTPSSSGSRECCSSTNSGPRSAAGCAQTQQRARGCDSGQRSKGAGPRVAPS